MHTARLLMPLAVLLCLAACTHPASVDSTKSVPVPVPASLASASPAIDASVPLNAGPRPLVGRILALDAARGFAFVDVSPRAPSTALVDGAELIARTDDLHETARLLATRQLRGRTLGTRIVSGAPAVGDEVALLVPPSALR